MFEKVLGKIREGKTDIKVVSTIYTKENNVECINDARSAAFYAFGEERKRGSAVLIINGYELQSAYTAITEAWFQKANLWIIALYENYDEINTTFLNRCVNKSILIDCESAIDKIDDNLRKVIGPKLINVMDTYYDTNTNDYSDIISKVEAIDETIEIITFNGKDRDNKNIENIYRYGILSKYLGKTAVSEKNSILICTSDVFLLDLNIFNNRYITEKFKIIVQDKDSTIKNRNIDKWIESNGISMYLGDGNIEQLIRNNKPGILIMGGAN